MASANFGYHGGPVIADPDIYITFWGPRWQTHNRHRARRHDLVQFMKDLIRSDYVNILTQYGVGKGSGRCGRVLRAFDVPNVAGQLDEAGLHTIVRGMVTDGELPDPGRRPKVALMIFFDEGIQFRDKKFAVLCEPRGDNAFGYHNYCRTARGNDVFYAVVPSLSGLCMQRSCPGGTGCSLSMNRSQLDRQTQVASHEFCEMVTDPRGTAWSDPKSGDENGDVCNWRSGTVTVQGRRWTVQRMYSLSHDLRGESPCILGSPTPIPRPR